MHEYELAPRLLTFFSFNDIFLKIVDFEALDYKVYDCSQENRFFPNVFSAIKKLQAVYYPIRNGNGNYR